jgi:hypothetical protein
LEHLIDIGQNGAMEIAVAVGFEGVAETAFGHFEDGVLDAARLLAGVRNPVHAGMRLTP